MQGNIVLYVEEEAEDLTWRSVARFDNLERNFPVFGLMAGVKGVDYLFAERGIPLDASPEVQELKIPKKYSPSFLFRVELQRALEKAERLGYPVSGAYKGIVQLMNALEGPSRVVFWFT